MNKKFTAYLVFTYIFFSAGFAIAKVDISTAQPVPDLIGLNEVKARSEIMLAGMTLGGTTRSSSALIPAGDVIGQTPASGIAVMPGTAVDIVVSAGPARYYVPDVAGLSQSDAEEKINAAELVVGRVTFSNSDNIPIGKVLSQVPLAETPLPRGGTVNLVVSSGLP